MSLPDLSISDIRLIGLADGPGLSLWVVRRRKTKNGVTFRLRGLPDRDVRSRAVSYLVRLPDGEPLRRISPIEEVWLARGDVFGLSLHIDLHVVP